MGKASLEDAKKRTKKPRATTSALKTSEKEASNYVPTTATEAKVIMLAKEIANGMSRQGAMEYAKTHFHIGPDQAYNYYQAAMRYLVPENVEEYRANLAQANIDRLEHIIEKAMENQQWKIAREAIDSLNKMLGINGNIQVGLKTDPDSKTTEFIIKINE